MQRGGRTIWGGAPRLRRAPTVGSLDHAERRIRKQRPALLAVIGGKSGARNLRLGPELEKVGREVDTYRSFVRFCVELVEVNEQLCQRRPVREVVDARALAQLKIK